MNKQDLVDAVAKRLGVDQGQGQRDRRAVLRGGRSDRRRARRGGKGGRSAGSAASRLASGRRAKGANPRTGKASASRPSTVPAFRASRGAAGSGEPEAADRRTVRYRPRRRAGPPGRGATGSARRSTRAVTRFRRIVAPFSARAILLRLLRRDLDQRVRVPQLDPPDLARSTRSSLVSTATRSLAVAPSFLPMPTQILRRSPGCRGSRRRDAGPAARAGPELVQRGRHRAGSWRSNSGASVSSARRASPVSMARTIAPRRAAASVVAAVEQPREPRAGGGARRSARA